MISSLRLVDWKCFHDQRLRLSPLTLFTGVNGMGKSSALQAVLTLRQSADQGLLSRRMLALNGDLVQIGTAGDALFVDGGDDFGFDVTVDGGQELSYRFAYDKDADVVRQVGAEQAATDVWARAFHYLCAERIGPRPFFGISEQRVRHAHQLGTRGEFTVQYLNVFANEAVTNPRLLHEGAASKSLRSQVEAWLSEITPGTRLVITAHASLDLVQLGFEFARAGDVSETYRPTNVGFGLTYTLPILVAILSAQPGSLLILENPEAHLHPRGQLRIGGLLARAAAGGVQVLVETHSDHVLNGVRLAVHEGSVAPSDVGLHYFSRNKSGHQANVASPTIDRDGRIDQWPDGFFDEWDAALDRLLRPAVR